MKILIIEDDQFCQQMLSAQVSAYGECHSANDAGQAREKFQAALADEPYQLILLDLGLPEIDGLDLYREFQELEKNAGLKPDQIARIIVTTSETTPDVIEEAFDLGCSSYLMKPCTQTEIERELKKLELV